MLIALVHPDFPEYLIQEDGRVFRAVDSKRAPRAGDEMHGRILMSGYRQIKLVHRDGSQRSVRVNRLVAETFLGPAPRFWREREIRAGRIPPLTEQDFRWAAEGEVPPADMDCARDG